MDRARACCAAGMVGAPWILIIRRRKKVHQTSNRRYSRPANPSSPPLCGPRDLDALVVVVLLLESTLISVLCIWMRGWGISLGISTMARSLTLPSAPNDQNPWCTHHFQLPIQAGRAAATAYSFLCTGLTNASCSTLSAFHFLVRKPQKTGYKMR